MKLGGHGDRGGREGRYWSRSSMMSKAERQIEFGPPACFMFVPLCGV